MINSHNGPGTSILRLKTAMVSESCILTLLSGLQLPLNLTCLSNLLYVVDHCCLLFFRIFPECFWLHPGFNGSNGS